MTPTHPHMILHAAMKVECPQCHQPIYLTLTDQAWRHHCPVDGTFIAGGAGFKVRHKEETQDG